MTLAELKALEKKVVKAIASYEARQKKKARDVLEAKAKEMGFSLAELAGDDAPKAKRKVRGVGVAKYRNPDDDSQTWTGMGRRPGWVIDALDAGGSLDDLAI
ncbi:DNA-binding protein H-NS [Thalassovita taeanensis]|uniref:DNA-binding protein H-NS n=2 Tax=Thalassovita taeanensis TaxID=657014 RepID=A0A1H9IFN7_9RHOB|nr:H-NS histone family protein [Thalassovita taeanensis]SEQ73292.1 DNA-binding protein H-NS [Thalassovita taeanensis]